MKTLFNKKIKLVLTSAVIALFLTGCGSSTEEEQLAWIGMWNSQYEAKLKMLNVCYKEAGVHTGTKRMSKNQKKVVHECEFDYMIDQADDDGVSLELELLKDNVIQF